MVCCERARWVIKLRGKRLQAFRSERIARLFAIRYRRDGWGMAYVERI